MKQQKTMRNTFLAIFIFFSTTLYGQSVPYADSLNYYFAFYVNDYRESKGLSPIWLNLELEDYAMNHLYYMTENTEKPIEHSIVPLANNDINAFLNVIKDMFGPYKFFVENIAKLDDYGKFKTKKDLAKAALNYWKDQPYANEVLLNEYIGYFYLAHGYADGASYFELIGIN